MPCNYQELEQSLLQIATPLCRPSQSLDHVSAEDSAEKVMTDLCRMSAVTISPSAFIDEAEMRMKNLGVKLLFVTDARERVIGLLTFTDISGERPLKFMQSNQLSRQDICVLDIMTGIEQVDCLSWNQVSGARVGDIALTMKSLGRQHALVVEECQGEQHIRGMFSITQIGKQLGIEIEANETARTFAEIGQRLCE